MPYEDYVFKIAEEAQKGAADSYIRELCEDVAYEFDMQTDRVYADSQAVYFQYFA